MRNLLILAVFLGASVLSGNAGARSASDGPNAAPGVESGFDVPQLRVAQGGGMSLSQAIDSVRRRGNVERIISAETTVRGGQETHHIKVLTKDGKVKTYNIAGRKRG